MVARHLLQQYMDYECPAYRKQFGSSQYTRVLTESDLPGLHEPSDIWRSITGLLGVYVEGVADVTYCALVERAARFRACQNQSKYTIS